MYAWRSFQQPKKKVKIIHAILPIDIEVVQNHAKRNGWQFVAREMQAFEHVVEVDGNRYTNHYVDFYKKKQLDGTFFYCSSEGNFLPQLEGIFDDESKGDNN